MYNKSNCLPLDIVQHYLQNNTSLRKTARQFNIHYQTLFKWVKLYHNHKRRNLASLDRRPWNRKSPALEEKIALLKEREPTLTVRKAKELLNQEGIRISIHGIWEIWRRNGYAGFKKENMCNSFIEYIPWTKKAQTNFSFAKEYAAKGQEEKAAKILNGIPSLPKNDLITRIPDNLLNLRRRIEKTACLFGQVPLPQYLRMTKALYTECTSKQYYYSALRVGIMTIIALEWQAKPEEKLSKIEELKKIVGVKSSGRATRLFETYFTLLISEGIANAILLRVKKAQKIARICAGMLKRKTSPSPYFLHDLGVLYLNLEDYAEAEFWFGKSYSKVDREMQKMLDGYLALIHLSKGEYKEATAASKQARFGEWGNLSVKALFHSILLLVKGYPKKAINLAYKSLALSKKEELNRNIFNALLTIASAYGSIGEKNRASLILRDMLPFLEKKNLKKYTSILEQLPFAKQEGKALMISQKELLPTAKIALLLRNKNYQEAQNYAERKGLMAFFYRYIFLFPEVVINLLDEGKTTGLPKAILRLPVFNSAIPVYNIYFLGKLVVYKNERNLHARLPPKDAALLIQLALRASEPNMHINLAQLFNNFWKTSSHPARNLSHILVRIKKALKMPSHLLEVSSRRNVSTLINKGIHFITDYDEYHHLLSKAMAFVRAGEWDYAKREYTKAFFLFRGEPFRKMYDDWSDDKRLEVLFSYETEVLAFAKELIKRGRKEEAEKLLRRAEKILPDIRLQAATILNSVPT